MIIIEGVDRVGKSSLAKALARHMPGYEVVHCVVPPEGQHVFDYHEQMLHGFTRSNLIVDRLHWSEYAYGLTYRNACGYSVKQWERFESSLLRLGARVILLSDTTKLIKDRWGPDQQFDVASLVRLNGFFFDLFYDRGTRVSKLPRMNLNWRDLFNPNGSERDDAVKTVAEYSLGADAT